MCECTARCLVGFRVLGAICAEPHVPTSTSLVDVDTTAKGVCAYRDPLPPGDVIGIDLEASPGLSKYETQWLARAVAEAETDVARRLEESTDLEQAIVQLRAIISAQSHMRTATARPDIMAPDREIRPESSTLIPAEAEAPGGLCSDLQMPQLTPKEELQMAEAQLVACERSRVELEEKTRIARTQLDAWRVKEAMWSRRLALLDAVELRHLVPIFPVGDALLEPFWYVCL